MPVLEAQTLDPDFQPDFLQIEDLDPPFVGDFMCYVAWRFYVLVLPQMYQDMVATDRIPPTSFDKDDVKNPWKFQSALSNCFTRRECEIECRRCARAASASSGGGGWALTPLRLLSCSRGVGHGVLQDHPEAREGDIDQPVGSAPSQLPCLCTYVLR